MRGRPWLGEPPGGVRRRASRLRRRAGRRRRAGAGARRRPEGHRRAHQLRKLATVTEVKSEELAGLGVPAFVAAEVRGHGAQIEQDAADVAGPGRRPGPPVPGGGGRPARQRLPRRDADRGEGEAVLRRPRGGEVVRRRRRRLLGSPRAALEELRWALDGGTPPVLVTSAFAGAARGMARYLSAPRGMREADLAREVGVPPWKLRTIRDQSSGWSDAGISRAIRTIAQADADIKGARQRRVVHPGAAGADRHRSARPDLIDSTPKCARGAAPRGRRLG